MNIKFGTDNFYVKYLKRFLNHELSQTGAILGKFDKADQQSLIHYLNLPNVKDMFSVEKEITEKFPELNTLFNMKLKDNLIQWTSKNISDEESNFIINNLDAIKDYCESVGWEVDTVSEWVDLTKDINGDNKVDSQDRTILYNIVYSNATYPQEIMDKADLNLDGVIDSTDVTIMDNYLIDGKLRLDIKQGSRKNYFPNKDMLVFVNQFDGTFIYNYAIRDEIGRDDVPHYNTSGLYKIALYKCTPGEKVTIAHNSSQAVHLVIGCSFVRLKQDIVGSESVLQNVVEVDLKAGEGYQYTCSSVDIGNGYDANWLCIQCPSNYDDVFTANEKSLILEVGDINFDGRIDMQDYTLLARYTAEGPGSEQLHWEATPKQLAVMDINKDGQVNIEDAQILYKFVEGDPTYPSLGTTVFTYDQSGNANVVANVSNLLIIQGHYDQDVNIPFIDFVTDDWIVHEKFFNYLLNMAIHKYSNSQDITYLQQLMKEYYPEHMYDEDFFYPGVYSDNMKKIMKDYQLSKAYFTLGDLNRDNQLNSIDLKLLRDYLDDATDYNLIVDYLAGKIELTPEQIKKLDRNNNGQVDLEDEQTFKDELDSKYSATFRTRADVNQDGYINEDDYTLLEKEVNGESTTLRQFQISFMLGWYDVQTEALFESEYNYNETISEVSK